MGIDIRAERDHLETLVTTGNDFDRKIIREIPGAYGRYADFKDKRVLDIGAQIGSLSVYAAWKGANLVIAVEPLPRNIEILNKNCAPYPQITIIPSACVQDMSIPRIITSGAEISNHEGSNFGLNILRKTSEARNSSRSSRHECSLVSFDVLLRTYRPQIIKMDCEGTEHELLTGYVAFPEVEALLLEIHFNDWRYAKGWPAILKALLDQGFRIVRGRESTIDGTGHHGVLILLRN